MCDRQRFANGLSRQRKGARHAPWPAGTKQRPGAPQRSSQGRLVPSRLGPHSPGTAFDATRAFDPRACLAGRFADFVAQVNRDLAARGHQIAAATSPAGAAASPAGAGSALITAHLAVPHAAHSAVPHAAHSAAPHTAHSAAPHTAHLAAPHTARSSAALTSSGKASLAERVSMSTMPAMVDDLGEKKSTNHRAGLRAARCRRRAQTVALVAAKMASRGLSSEAPPEARLSAAEPRPADRESQIKKSVQNHTLQAPATGLSPGPARGPTLGPDVCWFAATWSAEVGAAIRETVSRLVDAWSTETHSSLVLY
jgi:hypothetical protein